MAASDGGNVLGRPPEQMRKLDRLPRSPWCRCDPRSSAIPYAAPARWSPMSATMPFSFLTSR